MPLVEWEDRMMIGLDGIDEEHRQLIGMLNDMFDAAQDGARRAELLASLGRFIASTQAHFRSEEAYLEKTGYPEADAHKKEHEVLLHQIRKVQNDFESQLNVRLPPRLMAFLKNWFIDHVLNSDRKIKTHLLRAGIR